MDMKLNFLTENEIRNVHEYALELLETMGVEVCNDEAVDYFVKNGATAENNIVKIPRAVIEKGLSTTIKHDDFVLYGRTPDQDFALKDSLPTIHAMTMATNVIDPVTGKRQPATNEDLAKLTILLDKMGTVSAASALITPQDVQLDTADWYTWATSLKYTTKHITGGCVGKEGVRDAIRMASIAIGSEEEFNKRPFISVWALTKPPFCFDENMMNTLMETAAHNVTNVISSGGILGISSPMTLESALVQSHAEMLACIALTQFVRAGAPVIYSSFVRTMDMRTMGVCMASPESAMLRGAMAQMGRFLDLPVQMPLLLRDSKILDAQTGFETGLCGTIGALTCDYLVAMQMDSDLVVDYADIPYTNECMEELQRIAKPLDFSAERLGFDNLRETGHDGNFLGSPHTAAYFRDVWMGKLTERRSWAVWNGEGAKDITVKSREKAMGILEENGCKPLISEEACKAIDEIAENAIEKVLNIAR